MNADEINSEAMKVMNLLSDFLEREDIDMMSGVVAMFHIISHRIITSDGNFEKFAVLFNDIYTGMLNNEGIPNNG